jgi:cytochrome P450
MKQEQDIRRRGHWLLGSSLDFASGTLKFVDECIRDYPGGIVRARIAFKDFFVLLKPEYITHVLQKNHRNYRKSFAYDGLKPFLGQGLLTSEGDTWLRQRRLAQPAFHREHLHQLIQGMVESADFHFDSWSEGQEINIQREMGLLTQDIISKAVFGTTAIALPQVNRIGELLPVLRTYANDRMKKPFMPPLWMPTSYNRRFQTSVSDLRNIVLQAIRLRRHNEENPALGASPVEKREATLLHMLMQAQKVPDSTAGQEAMSDEQLYDEIVTIFIAGQETTTNAMGFLLLLLAQNHGIFSQIAEECNQLPEDGLNMESIYQLENTWQAVREALRLYPPAWAVSRQAIQADEIGGVSIPAGATAFLSVYAMHRHPDYWDTPHEFRPSRFAHDNYPKEAYLPFGAGPRKCIGSHFAMLEMVVILARLVRRFKLELLSDPVPKLITPMTMSTKEAIRFRVKVVES